MAHDFGARTSNVAALKGVLNVYNFSTRILLEIIQNSEDAGATRQTFVYDKRRHHAIPGGMHHPKLAQLQGPALLAFNDAVFREGDWDAMQTLYESSKTNDSSKIGKFGVGFRSVYHITDCPQILSGDALTISDPLEAYTDSPGKRLHLPSVSKQLSAQLQPFSHFLDGRWDAEKGYYQGTVIRCPLRTRDGPFGAPLSTNVMSELLQDFCAEHLDVSLLFLRNIREIDILEIEEDGTLTTLGTCTIARAPMQFQSHPQCTMFDVSVNSTTRNNAASTGWKLFTRRFSDEDVFTSFPERLESLKKLKLNPHISFGIPSSVAAGPQASGRLFTFLPLETKTGLPFHLDASFALTQSRTNLRNKGSAVARGSDDELMTEHNTYLFDHLIPQTWKTWLEGFAPAPPAFDIFNVWPSHTPELLSGDSVYWQSLPEHVFSLVTNDNLPIWPAYPSPPSSFLPLQDFLVADGSAGDDLCRALVAMGVKLTLPPAYIVAIIKSRNDPRFKLLSPHTAHSALLAVLPFPPHTEKYSRVVLDYLVSSSDIRNIIGIPLFPTVEGTLVALQAKAGAPRLHTLLTRAEHPIFSSCDNEAIPVASIPLSPLNLNFLQEAGPSVLNVELLTVEKIVEYVAEYPKRLGLEPETSGYARTVQWLSELWSWMASWGQKARLFEVFSKESSLALPSTTGLQPTTTPVFSSQREHQIVVKHLQALGVVFLRREVSDRAHESIAGHGLLKSIHHIHDLLSYIRPVSGPALPPEGSKVILRHISDRIEGSCQDLGPLEANQLATLKTLPIYPIFQSPNGVGSFARHYLSTLWSKIPEETSLCAIPDLGWLPVVPGLTFVDSENVRPAILERVEDTYRKPLSAPQVLDLVLESFTSQPASVQAAILTSIAQNPAPSHVQKLKGIPFVPTRDGTFNVPGDVIDPKSAIYELYKTDLTKIPRNETREEQAILSKLRVLRPSLLRTTLSPEMVLERIDYISQRSVAPDDQIIKIAQLLLTSIPIQEFKGDKFNLPLDVKWIPSKDKTLVEPLTCREENDPKSPLFNRVFSVLDTAGNKVRVTPDLRRLLGWTTAIPTDVIIQQLSIVIDDEHEVHHRRNHILGVIIKELASRQDAQIVEKVIEVVEGKKWIPTTQGDLGKTKDCLFHLPPPGTNFDQVYPVLVSSRPDVKIFLSHVGVRDQPDADALLGKLHECTPGDVDTAIQLLKAISKIPNLTDEQRNRIIVPDTTGELQPLSQTSYDDLGPKAYLAPQDEAYFLSHPSIDELLASQLGIEKLGLRFASLKDIERNIGVSTLDFIRNTLRQYTKLQFATEFLANAIDAGARTMNFCLNEWWDSSGGRLLRPEMRRFVDVPSLVVHNDAQFEDKDFEGLLRSSVGTKRDRSDTIGEFGLGALTMFYFTEFAMVVSRNHVLFLNPSKEALGEYSALKFELNHIRRNFPGHLRNIHGLFEFDADPSNVGPYDGTIFYLPLRSLLHSTGVAEPIFDQPYGIEPLRTEILQPFYQIAHRCLLFSDFDNLALFSRTDESPDSLTEEWLVASERRKDANVVPGTTSWRLTIDQVYEDEERIYSHWRVAEAVIPSESIPGRFSRAIGRRVRTSTVGVAFCLDDAPPDPSPFKYFSKLPLAENTALPAHISASFILSPDRRSIRFDAYDTEETEYNRWILTDPLPKLYLFLLGRILLDPNHPSSNGRWWPHQPRVGAVEVPPITRVFEDAFYNTCLPVCRSEVFASSFEQGYTLTFRDAVFSYREPETIFAIARNAQEERVVLLPDAVVERVVQAGGRPISPHFLKGILSDPDRLDQYRQSVDFRALEDFLSVISFLCQESPQNLYELELLPLADESWATFGPIGFTDTFFTSKKLSLSGISPLFPLSRFVHPKFKPEDFLEDGVDINIRNLDPGGILELVGDRVSENDRLEDVQQEDADWILNFWTNFSNLGIKVEVIAHLPLIPTTQPGVFVSLQKCSTRKALLIRSLEGDLTSDERDAFESLGLDLVIVNRHGDPPALRNALMLHALECITLAQVLIALSENAQALNADLQTLIGILTPEPRLIDAFSSWARARIETLPSELLPAARTLPIWPAESRESPIGFHPSSEVHMLPPGFDARSISRFTTTLISNHGPLERLEGPSLSPEDLLGALHLDDPLDDADLGFYFSFLQTLLPQLTSNMPLYHIKVPRSDLFIANVDDLLARDDLFIAAFGEGSPRFAHRQFARLEPSLQKYGLRGEASCTIDILTDCIEAIGSIPDDDEGKVGRATVVYHKYHTTNFHLSNEAEYDFLFDVVKSIAFVPRNMGNRHRRAPEDPEFDLPESISNLPAVVRPDQLVLEDLEPVAWSQRATFAEQPSRFGVATQPSLGQPSYQEVIEHLRYLADHDRWALMSRPKRDAWYMDLIATYGFLNARIEGHERDIQKLSYEPLFLNVTSPGDPWRFDAGRNMAFIPRDDGLFRAVCTSLLPFSTLLHHAGVVAVILPTWTGSDPPVPSGTDIHIRNAFNQFRAESRFIDVQFVIMDDPEAEQRIPLIGHRAYLAAAADYFMGAFTEGFSEAQIGVVAQYPVYGYSYECVKALLDFIYTGTLEHPSELDLELALEVLQLADFWHVEQLSHSIQRRITEGNFITPQTVHGISSIAQQYHARDLASVCQQYIKDNEIYIDRSAVLQPME